MEAQLSGDHEPCNITDVVPANAGTHTPRPIRDALELVAFAATKPCG